MHTLRGVTVPRLVGNEWKVRRGQFPNVGGCPFSRSFAAAFARTDKLVGRSVAYVLSSIVLVGNLSNALFFFFAWHALEQSGTRASWQARRT